MKYEGPVRVVCPYCGHENTLYTTAKVGHHVILCGIETGGCDARFVAEVALKPVVTTYAMTAASYTPTAEDIQAEGEFCPHCGNGLPCDCGINHAHLIAEEMRINEYEMWGPAGRPAGPFA